VLEDQLDLDRRAFARTRLDPDHEVAVLGAVRREYGMQARARFGCRWARHLRDVDHGGRRTRCFDDGRRSRASARCEQADDEAATHPSTLRSIRFASARDCASLQT
jgi:hypothetical protein